MVDNTVTSPKVDGVEPGTGHLMSLFETESKMRKNAVSENCVNCGKPNTPWADGRKRSRCSACTMRGTHNKRKEALVELLGGCCKLCGYNRCNRALTFHHLDPSTKSFGIADGNRRSWERDKAEAEKCVLLCHNCHSEIHAGVASLVGHFTFNED